MAQGSNWQTYDPLTLVEEARSVIQQQQVQADVRGPIDEVINRFEKLTQATMGENKLLAEALQSGKS